MSKVKLLCIIDDDPIFVFGAKRLIEINDAAEKVIVYHDGAEALAGLRAITDKEEALPDVIFLDLNMPILDGWQFLDAFKDTRLPKKISIYIVTSSIDPRDHEKAEHYSEVTDFIVKPVKPSDLKEMLEKWTGPK